MESLQIDKQRLGIKPLVKVPKENYKKTYEHSHAIARHKHLHKSHPI